MKTKQIIMVLLLFTSLFYLVTAENNLEINENTLTLALCYELQELDTGFEDYSANENNLEECNSFLTQWDTDGDWFSDEEELEIGTDPENSNENPNTLDDVVVEENVEDICVQGDNFCATSYEEECFDYLGDYDSDCLDNDEDGFYNYEEYNSNTDKDDPNSAPWWTDLDNDGYRNLAEMRGGSDCLNEDIMPGWTDTDHDQYSDTYEMQVGTDPFDGQDVPEELPFIGTYETDKSTETKQTGTGWQIYLAILLAVLLIVMLTIYFIYYNKYGEKY